MTTKQSYDEMTQAELLKLATERGVANPGNFRKAEFQRLFKAMDEGDDAVIAQVTKAADERGEKVKRSAEQQNPNAARVMEMAKANQGVPIAAKPTADLANLKAGASVEQAAEIAKVSGELAEESKAPPKLDYKAGGQRLIDQIKARAQQLTQHAPRKGDVVTSRAADALFMARGQKTEHKKLDVDVFEVLEDGTYFSRHGTYKLPKGSIVSAATHDMAMITKQRIKLRQIDPTKNEIVYSELGHPIGMKTIPVEEPAPEAAT